VILNTTDEPCDVPDERPPGLFFIFELSEVAGASPDTVDGLAVVTDGSRWWSLGVLDGDMDDDDMGNEEGVIVTCVGKLKSSALLMLPLSLLGELD